MPVWRSGSRSWDLALADLEQAAAWAQSDPPTEFAIAAAYLQCLPNQPDRFPRWLALLPPGRCATSGRRCLTEGR